MLTTPDLTEEQWQWVVERYREGYPQTELCKFLGMWRNSLFRILQRRSVIPYAIDELDPLESRREEFEALGEEERRREAGQQIQILRRN